MFNIFQQIIKNNVDIVPTIVLWSICRQKAYRKYYRKWGERMTDLKTLKVKIKEAGIMKGRICKELDITYPSLQRRLDGRVEFNNVEIQKISDLLGLTVGERNRIFFDTKLANSQQVEV